MNCPKCGRENEDGAMYCCYCGSSMNPIDKKESNISSVLIFIWIAGTAILFLFSQIIIKLDNEWWHKNFLTVVLYAFWIIQGLLMLLPAFAIRSRTLRMIGVIIVSLLVICQTAGLIFNNVESTRKLIDATYTEENSYSNLNPYLSQDSIDKAQNFLNNWDNLSAEEKIYADKLIGRVNRAQQQIPNKPTLSPGDNNSSSTKNESTTNNVSITQDTLDYINNVLKGDVTVNNDDDYNRIWDYYFNFNETPKHNRSISKKIDKILGDYYKKHPNEY
jgi:hypothetical protein